MGQSSPFFSRLKELQKKREKNEAKDVKRRWVYVAYDQLSHEMGPLAEGGDPPDDADAWGAVLVENPAKAQRRPYHQHKLALLLANHRHFALELEERQIAVRYVVHAGTYAEGLRTVLDDTGPLCMLRPAERELREDLRELVEAGDLKSLRHPGWLTRPDDFEDAVGHHKRWRMDAFYRLVRQRTGVMMTDDDKPEGGRYSFDGDNRESWPGDPPAPDLPSFEHDDVTGEVLELVANDFGHHPGRPFVDHLPTTRKHAEDLWEWAKTECMEHFGPYEDAISKSARTLFHTRVSPLVNLHRLRPKTLLDDVVALDIPINSKEGFVRQLLGWREFVHHVHERTDGFRSWETKGYKRIDVDSAKASGTGGYERWAEANGEKAPKSKAGQGFGGSLTNHLNIEARLPLAFWRGAAEDESVEPSGLHCLDHVVDAVWDEGYSHHITRLMVLSNIALLLDVNPREITDWFWVAYADAYDWVVEPNVLGMGVFAAGDLMTTKPYVAGSGYISKMGDSCDACAFNPKTNCPLRELYWAFLERHKKTLNKVDRMRLPMASLEKRSNEKRKDDEKLFDWVQSTLGEGKTLTLDGRKQALKGAS